MNDEIYDLKEKIHHLELALDRLQKEYTILADDYDKYIIAFDKLKRENFGLKQTILNYKEQMEKHYRNMR